MSTVFICHQWWFGIFQWLFYHWLQSVSLSVSNESVECYIPLEPEKWALFNRTTVGIFSSHLNDLSTIYSITPSVPEQKLRKNHDNLLLYHLYPFHIPLSSYLYIEVWKVDNHCNFSNNWSYAHVDLEIYPARGAPLASTLVIQVPTTVVDHCLFCGHN